MKRIVIALLSLYQIIFSWLLDQIFGPGRICRFSPTCSEYAKQTIAKYGILKGGYLSLLRLLKCNPFYNQAQNAKLKVQSNSLKLKEK